MPEPVSVSSDPVLPERADAVIIGGGIAGVGTALELAERGMSVALFEKGRVAGEQSSRNWGWCRKMGRDPREVPLAKVALDEWRAMRQRVGAEVGWRECGIAYLCETDAQMERRIGWAEEIGAPNDLTTRVLSAPQAQALTPGATIRWRGGLATPDDGRAEPTLAVPAMAEALRRRGGTVHQGCAVRALEREAGRVAGVVTERGTVRSPLVVLAGGAWSRRFLGNEGVDFPQLTVTNSVMRTEPLDAGLAHSLAGAGFAIRKRLDGGWTVAHDNLSVADIVPDSFRLLRRFGRLACENWRDYRFRLGPRFAFEASLARRWGTDEASPFEKARTLDPEHVGRIGDAALAALRRVLPQFREVRIAERWAGVIDVTPDVVPVIGPVDAIPGLLAVTGFSGHGFGLGPGAARLAAEIATGATPCVDPEPFRFGRFG